MIEIVRAQGATVVAARVIVDRRGDEKPDFGCPFVSLIDPEVETFEGNEIPADLAALPAVKPGSK